MVARLTAGTVFAGEYRVERTLFEGDDRGVYEVEQKSTGRRLALKVLSPDLLPDEASRARFLDEARVNGRVRTEHVLDVHAAGVDTESGLPWVASELLEGENLDQAIGRTAPLRDWDELLSQTMHGLAAVHAIGVVHGALNGESIFLAKSTRGEPFRVELLDFGVPRSARMKAIATATRLPWMAPEQLTEGATLTPATDVWAVGLLGFRALTGKHYMHGADAAAVEAAIRAGATEAASARATALGVTASLPRAFDAWFARCTKSDPAARFANAHDALEGAADLLSEASGVEGAIEAVTEAPRVKPKPPPLPPMVRAIAENPKPAIAIIGVLILGALGVGFGVGSLRGNTVLSGPAAVRAAAIPWTKAPIERATKACDDGDSTACHGLGQLYQYGDRAPHDEKKAADLFGKACDAKNVAACASLASLLIGAEKLPHDPARAAQLYQRACDENDGVSCADLAELYSAGNGVAKNEARALELRNRACQSGIKELCK